MQGSLLRFYVHENQRHAHQLLWEWLLTEANKLGIGGGSAFRAMAGFGRHQVLRDEHFFELGGTLTIEVEFIVTAQQQEELMRLVQGLGIPLFYACLPATFGFINPDAANTLSRK
jgi:PII-like signaling protein